MVEDLGGLLIKNILVEKKLWIGYFSQQMSYSFTQLARVKIIDR